MKLAQYTSQERAIAAADSSGIRQRWAWGLRLLNDKEKLAPAGGLKHGVADQLIAAAAKRGHKLSASEIRWRLQCARTYPTEAQIAAVCSDFETWWDLTHAGFPAVPAPEGEPPADWRTQAEKDHARAQALADLFGEQGSLFPLSQFEPAEVTLKELVTYADEQDDLTERFAEHGRKRREYLARLLDAAGGDESVTWAEAQCRLDGEATA
jgi:hypothetical protein